MKEKKTKFIPSIHDSQVLDWKQPKSRILIPYVRFFLECVNGTRSRLKLIAIDNENSSSSTYKPIIVPRRIAKRVSDDLIHFQEGKEQEQVCKCLDPRLSKGYSKCERNLTRRSGPAKFRLYPPPQARKSYTSQASQMAAQYLSCTINCITINHEQPTRE